MVFQTLLIFLFIIVSVFKYLDIMSKVTDRFDAKKEKEYED